MQQPLFVLLLTFACACSSTPDGIVPRPYSSSQIRATNTPGTSLVFLIHQQGSSPVHQIFEFGETDGEYVELGGRLTDEAGEDLGGRQVSKPRWEELRDHATYSALNTTRNDEAISVPAGDFECTLYTVRKEDGSTDRFYFAKSRPGPPVLCTTCGPDGAESFRMELISVSKR